MAAWRDFLDSLSNLAEEHLDDEDLRSAMESMLLIRPKTGNALVPFRLNPAQEHYWSIRTQRDYVLKGRQLGLSSLTLAEFFMRCVLLPNQNAVIIAHRKESATRLFERVRLFYQHLPVSVKQAINGGRTTAATDTKNEMFFSGNNSRLFVSTANAPDATRGLTLTMIHLSEAAFYDENGASAEETLSAVLGTATPEAVVRIETTPNVAASFAYQEWRRAQSGESRFQAVFLPWYIDPEYRLPEALPESEWTAAERTMVERFGLDGHQLAWYRRTSSEQRNKMKREFPNDAEEGWLHSGETVFNLERVLECWAPDLPDPTTAGTEALLPGERWLRPREECAHLLTEGHKYVVGADPAEGTPDGDFSAIQAFDRKTGDQVYAAHMRIPVYQFAGHLESLGRSLGGALLIVERNNHGHAVLQRLLYDLNYPNVYFADDGQPGVHTTAREKAVLLGELDRSFWERGLTLRDPATFNDLRSYLYDERRRANAASGAHDDLVSALLCANRGLVRSVGRVSYSEVPYPKPGPTLLEEAAASGAMGWIKSGVPGMPPAPFYPDLVEPGAPPLLGARRPWTCACGGTELRIVGASMACTRCGTEIAPAQRRAVVGRGAVR